jgi:methyl-accepting chemotaxis protein
MNIMAQYDIEQLSMEDLKAIITTLQEERNELSVFVEEMALMRQNQKAGDIEWFMPIDKFTGVYRTMAEGVNEQVGDHIGVKKQIVEVIRHFGDGDFSVEMEQLPGKKAFITHDVNQFRDRILSLLKTIETLTIASAEGKLNTRANASGYKGDWAGLIEGINKMLDAILLPIGEGNRVLEQIRGGNLREKVEIDCYGDHKNMKDAINGVHAWLSELIEYVTALANGDMTAKMGKASDLDQIHEHLIKLRENTNALVSDAMMLSKAAVEGKLETRADAKKHRGDFRKIVEGVNNTLDAVINPLNVAANYVDRISRGDIPTKITDSYNGDFNLIKNNLNTCIDAVNLLVSDANLLSRAAVEGKLETRADAKKHQGDFKKIVEGVNNTLDSVIIPVNEALRVSQQYANYQFTTRVDPDLKVTGDWVQFKKALDNIGIQISGAVELINNQVTDLTINAKEATIRNEEVAAGARQVAEITRGVSRNTEVGNDGIIQILKAMEDLNTTVGEVSRRAEQVSTFAVQANEFSKDGIDLAKKSESSMTEITRSSNEVDQIVKEINAQMEEIGKIVRLISDIANQTNLLALNAAIEAARAGDAGRGFAVVAAEVKSLAQDSRKSAENIADMISTLQDKAQKATIAMAHSGEVVAEGSKSLTETLGAFNKIASSIEDITRNAMDVASASEEQAASVEEVTASIHEVSVLIVNTSKEAGDAAAATDEASASVEQISKIITNVSESVESVSREMEKFVV